VGPDEQEKKTWKLKRVTVGDGGKLQTLEPVGKA
jgi:hypothetical protein